MGSGGGSGGCGGGSCALQFLFVQEPIHVIRSARMEGVFLFLEPRPVGQHVMPFRLLPQVVELDQFADGARPHLLLLDVVEVFAEDAQTRFEIPAFLFRPEGGRLARRDVAHFPSPDRLFDVVSALQQLMECLSTTKLYQIRSSQSTKVNHFRCTLPNCLFVCL